MSYTKEFIAEVMELFDSGMNVFEIAITLNCHVDVVDMIVCAEIANETQQGEW